MKKKFVSVIVPIYNSENYLSDCINSLLRQTYKNVEIICVNDGSTDNSEEILKEFATNYQNIRVITQLNMGAYIARKNGIKNSKGEYLLFVDSDDFIDDNTIEKLVYYQEQYNVDVIKFGYRTFPKTSNKYTIINNLEYPYLSQGDKKIIYKELLTTNNLNSVSMMFVAKKIIREDDINNRLNLSEDFLQACYIYTDCKNALLIKDIFYNYRMNETSTTHLYTTEKIIENIQDEFKVFFKMLNLIKEWGNFNDNISFELLLLERLINNIFCIFIYKVINNNEITNEKLNEIVNIVVCNSKKIQNKHNYIKYYDEITKYRKYNKIKKTLKKKYSFAILKNKKNSIYAYTKFIMLINKINIKKRFIKQNMLF